MAKARQIRHSDRRCATLAFSCTANKLRSMIRLLKKPPEGYKEGQKGQVPPLNDCEIEQRPTFNICVYGDCGQDSAVLKNLMILNDGLSRDERKMYKTYVSGGLLMYIHQHLMRCCKEEGTLEEVEFNSEMDLIISKNMCGDDADVLYRPPREFLDRAIKMLESTKNHTFHVETDPFQRPWCLSAKFLSPFLSDIHRCFAPDYEPTREDIVLLESSPIKITKRKARITLDIGDVACCFLTKRPAQWLSMKQRYERLGGCKALIFIADLAGYNESTLWAAAEGGGDPHADDFDALRDLQRTLSDFESFCDSRHFAGRPIILLLNNVDTFTEKLKASKLEDDFPDFHGGDDAISARDYLLNVFVSKNKDEERQVYTHFMRNVTDATAWSFVDAAVKDIMAANGKKFFSQ